jgi:hypothetical protein
VSLTNIKQMYGDRSERRNPQAALFRVRSESDIFEIEAMLPARFLLVCVCYVFINSVRKLLHVMSDVRLSSSVL